nr:hypothetical protein [uncultured Porphyromonas sp.]
MVAIKQQVSFLARGCKSEIDAWLLRSLSPRYLVVYSLDSP